MARTGKDKNQSPGKTPDPQKRKTLGGKRKRNEGVTGEQSVPPPAPADGTQESDTSSDVTSNSSGFLTTDVHAVPPAPRAPAPVDQGLNFKLPKLYIDTRILIYVLLYCFKLS